MTVKQENGSTTLQTLPGGSEIPLLSIEVELDLLMPI